MITHKLVSEWTAKGPIDKRQTRTKRVVIYCVGLAGLFTATAYFLEMRVPLEISAFWLGENILGVIFHTD